MHILGFIPSCFSQAEVQLKMSPVSNASCCCSENRGTPKCGGTSQAHSRMNSRSLNYQWTIMACTWFICFGVTSTFQRHSGFVKTDR